MSNPPGPDHDATPPATGDPELHRGEPEPVTEVLHAVGPREPTAPVVTPDQESQFAPEEEPQFASDEPTDVMSVQEAPTQPRGAPGFDQAQLAELQTPPEGTTASIPVLPPPAAQSEYE